MDINIFGTTITIGKKKQDQSTDRKTNMMNFVQGNNLSIIGSDINACGNIRIDNRMMYRIHKMNKMAFAYKSKISQMVGRNGIEVYDSNGILVEGAESIKVKQAIYKHIGGRNKLDIFISDFFDELFCNGQVFAVPSVINGLGLADNQAEIKILDGRGMSLVTNKYGEVQRYDYVTVHGAESFAPIEILDYIGYKDIDYRWRGISIYHSVAMEAITNEFANKTQMYFFKNNAKPNVYIMLDPMQFAGTDGKEMKRQFDKEWDAKYGGPENVGKTYSSSNIKDIKTLDISNVDLDLINLREKNDEAFSAIFLLDMRLIGLQKQTGSYGEVESTTIRQGNEQMEAYGKMFGDFLTSYYKKFLDPNFTLEIRPRNAEFKNLNEDKKIALLEVEAGTITRDEYRVRFGEKPTGVDNMSKYATSKNINFIDDPKPVKEEIKVEEDKK